MKYYGLKVRESETRIANETSDLVQKCAWRLVRAAEDWMGMGKGDEKRSWCMKRLKQRFSDLDDETSEEFIRSAYINFKIEMSVLRQQEAV